MNKKLLNLLLLISFQFGYLEWGKVNHLFIFEAEQELFTKALSNFKGIMHPFILVPLLGMILLLITLVQKIPGRLLSVIGLACLSLLILMITFVGLLSVNVKMILSVIPFLVVGSLILFNNRKIQS